MLTPGIGILRSNKFYAQNLPMMVYSGCAGKIVEEYGLVSMCAVELCDTALMRGTSISTQETTGGNITCVKRSIGRTKMHVKVEGSH